MAQANTEVPAKAAKKALHIVYDVERSNLPSFEFVGVWTGFDISTIVSNLRRAYLKVKRDQRRGELSDHSNISAKGEIE